MVLATLLIDLLAQAAPLGQQLLSPPLPPSPPVAHLSLVVFTLDFLRGPCLWLCFPVYLQ